jgi:Holliday junction resolvase RusA-like endonuclease
VKQNCERVIAVDAIITPALPVARREADVTVVLKGHPRGKGRPRSRVATSKAGKPFVAVYTDQETRTYEAMLRHAADQATRAAIPGAAFIWAPLDCALRVRVTAIFLPPASWSGRKRREAIAGIVRPTGKPDGDNLLKCVGDALNGVVWRDDSVVVEWVIRKFFGEQPMIMIETWRHTSLRL